MLRRNLSTEEGLVNGTTGNVLELSSKNVTVKFDNITEPYKVSRITSRFCVLNKFYIHRAQFPLTVAYAVTIHKSQGLSLDCAIIDLSDKVFGEGIAYVALSRVRSLHGVYLTSFTPQSLMASRTCVQECNRLRQQFRPDLPQYQLPPARSVKRKMSASVAPQAKRPCRTNPCPTTCTTKRKLSGSECQPPPKVPKTIDTKLSDCYTVDQPQNQFVRQAFFFNL